MSDPLHNLVVEDEKAIAHIIAMLFGGPASKVASARNGWEDMMMSKPFDFDELQRSLPKMISSPAADPKLLLLDTPATLYPDEHGINNV
jgi:DNA-binding response OmpR family regulator